MDPGFQKRGRFDGPEDELSVPPATLRILVRQHDAGGIIGKARDPQNDIATFKLRHFLFSCREERTLRDFANWYSVYVAVCCVCMLLKAQRVAILTWNRVLGAYTSLRVHFYVLLDLSLSTC